MFTKSLIALSVIASTISSANAHCPTMLKAEKVCFMLDQNVLYLYDHKVEHNGPYKDLMKSKIESIKSDGKDVKFDHPSRGIYKIIADKTLTKLDLEISTAGKKETLQVQIEK